LQEITAWKSRQIQHCKCRLGQADAEVGIFLAEAGIYDAETGKHSIHHHLTLHLSFKLNH
jgi:hypothetical protein